MLLAGRDDGIMRKTWSLTSSSAEHAGQVDLLLLGISYRLVVLLVVVAVSVGEDIRVF